MPPRPYDTPEYRATRNRWAATIARTGTHCHAPICLYGDRTIPAGAVAGRHWDLGHDRTTGHIRGPEHTRCNRSEGARWGNRLRTRRARPIPRPVPRPTTPTVSVNPW